MNNGKILALFFLSLLFIIPILWKKQKHEKDIVVINVLDADLYNDCHIKGSINIPFDMIEKEASVLSKASEIVVYCSNYQCTTSDYVAKKLYDMGFEKIFVYEGGMAEWFQKGLAIEGPHRQGYLKKPCRKVAEEANSAIPTITAEELAMKLGVDADLKRAA